MSKAWTGTQQWILEFIGTAEESVRYKVAERGLAIEDVELLEVIGDVSDERRG